MLSGNKIVLNCRNLLDPDHAVPVEDHWPGAAAETAVHVRIPVTDGINLITPLIKTMRERKNKAEGLRAIN